MSKNYHQILNVRRGWTKIPNAIRHDEKLTSDAKVVIEELLAISGDFHISESGIASLVHMSLGRVKKAIRLLKSTGYIQITKVRDGSRFGGCEWKISDASGTFRETENPAFGNQSFGNQSFGNPSDGKPSERKTQHSEFHQTENPPIYQYTERYQQTNNQERIDKQTEENQLPHHQAQAVEEEEVSLPPYPGNISLENSSGERVMTQREFEFQQFLKKYPKKPTGKDMEATRQAFFELTSIEGSFTEIMAGLDAWCNSVDWTKENGRYITKPLYFLTTRKWEEIPRTINTEIDPGLLRFMTPADMEDYL